MAPLRGPASTYAGRTGRASLDVVAVPTDAAWRWGVQAVWRRHLSDHAGLVAAAEPGAPALGRALNPAAFRELPPEALVDLRLRFRLLEHTFGIPQVDLAGVEAGAGAGPAAEVGDLPAGHPAMAVLRDPPGERRREEEGPRDEVAQEGGTPVPFLPSLALAGRVALAAMARSWWDTWRHRRPRAGPGAALADAAGRRSRTRLAGPPPAVDEGHGVGGRLRQPG